MNHIKLIGITIVILLATLVFSQIGPGTGIDRGIGRIGDPTARTLPGSFDSIAALRLIADGSGCAGICEDLSQYQRSNLFVIPNEQVRSIGVTLVAGLSERLAVQNAPIIVHITSDGTDATSAADDVNDLRLLYTNTRGIANFDFTNYNAAGVCYDFKFIYCYAPQNACSFEKCFTGAGLNAQRLRVSSLADIRVIGTTPTTAQTPAFVHSAFSSYKYCAPRSNASLAQSFCFPLVIVFALLMGAMQISGRNPLRAFDFSAPRLGKHFRYTARGRGMGFSVDSIASGAIKAGQATTKAGRQVLGAQEAQQHGKGGVLAGITAGAAAAGYGKSIGAIGTLKDSGKRMIDGKFLEHLKPATGKGAAIEDIKRMGRDLDVGLFGGKLSGINVSERVQTAPIAQLVLGAAGVSDVKTLAVFILERSSFVGLYQTFVELRNQIRISGAEEKAANFKTEVELTGGTKAVISLTKDEATGKYEVVVTDKSGKKLDVTEENLIPVLGGYKEALEVGRNATLAQAYATAERIQKLDDEKRAVVDAVGGDATADKLKTIVEIGSAVDEKKAEKFAKLLKTGNETELANFFADKENAKFLESLTGKVGAYVDGAAAKSVTEFLTEFGALKTPRERMQYLADEDNVKAMKVLGLTLGDNREKADLFMQAIREKDGGALVQFLSDKNNSLLAGVIKESLGREFATKLDTGIRTSVEIRAFEQQAIFASLALNHANTLLDRVDDLIKSTESDIQKRQSLEKDVIESAKRLAGDEKVTAKLGAEAKAVLATGDAYAVATILSDPKYKDAISDVERTLVTADAKKDFESLKRRTGALEEFVSEKVTQYTAASGVTAQITPENTMALNKMYSNISSAIPELKNLGLTEAVLRKNGLSELAEGIDIKGGSALSEALADKKVTDTLMGLINTGHIKLKAGADEKLYDLVALAQEAKNFKQAIIVGTLISPSDAQQIQSNALSAQVVALQRIEGRGVENIGASLSVLFNTVANTTAIGAATHDTSKAVPQEQFGKFHTQLAENFKEAERYVSELSSRVAVLSSTPYIDPKLLELSPRAQEVMKDFVRDYHATVATQAKEGDSQALVGTLRTMQEIIKENPEKAAEVAILFKASLSHNPDAHTSLNEYLAASQDPSLDKQERAKVQSTVIAKLFVTDAYTSAHTDLYGATFRRFDEDKLGSLKDVLVKDFDKRIEKTEDPNKKAFLEQTRAHIDGASQEELVGVLSSVTMTDLSAGDVVDKFFRKNMKVPEYKEYEKASDQLVTFKEKAEEFATSYYKGKEPLPIAADDFVEKAKKDLLSAKQTYTKLTEPRQDLKPTDEEREKYKEKLEANGVEKDRIKELLAAFEKKQDTTLAGKLTSPAKEPSDPYTYQQPNFTGTSGFRLIWDPRLNTWMPVADIKSSK